MNRRNFLILSSLSLALANLSYAKGIEPQSALVLEEVFDILFPKTKQMPSAREFGATSYLIKNIQNTYFDKADAHLIIQGTLDFHSSFPNFSNVSKKEQKMIIQTASQNEYGNEWLTKLLRYGFEALLGDPIYGGNINQVGWKALQHKAGMPRPKVTYARRLV